MADPILTERRTRSQIQLPDSDFHLNRSPLKEARAASRNQHESLAGPMMEFGDDELNLVSTKVPSGSKRSPSPSGSELNGDKPRVKRLKPDVDLNSSNSENIDSTSPRTIPPTHTRHYSDPSVVFPQGKRRKRSATSSKPVSASQAATRYLSPAPGTPKKERARSVPLFSSVHIPVIDFRNPPESPVRSRSRSPSKEIFRIKVVSPIKEIEVNNEESSIGSSHVEKESTGIANSASFIKHPTPPIADTGNSLSDTPASKNDTEASAAIISLIGEPSTPRPPNPYSIPLSPLTPIPETPFPTRKLQGSVEDRVNQGWTLGVIAEVRASGVMLSRSFIFSLFTDWQ
jgi:hypothetical protein